MQDEKHLRVPRILVIDDNTAIHDDFKKILCPADDHQELEDMESELFGDESSTSTPIGRTYTIDSAFQGEEGLGKIIESVKSGDPYSLAFVDMRMPPGWDGVETIEQIWKHCPDIEIVICTAYSDYSWTEMIERLGPSDKLLILKKPFDTAEVCQLAAALTRKRELAQQAELNNEKLRVMVEDSTEKLRDEITERQQLESRLLHAQKLEAVGQLAAGIAHEINTPAQFVGDNIRFLQDSFNDLDDILKTCHELMQGTDPEQAAAIVTSLAEKAKDADIEFIVEEVPLAAAQAIDGIKRISEIVRAMKEFSHPGTTEKTSVDLNQAIRSTATIAKNEWKYVADLNTELDESMPQVPCYPGELNQVILNIVVNAAHAIGDTRENDSAPKGTITISTRTVDDQAEIRIADTGGGIPEKIRNRIFEPFFTTKGVGKGTGQGLAIAHDVITHKHGGTLQIESEMNVGTTFVVRIPLTSVETPDQSTISTQQQSEGIAVNV